MRPWRRSIIFGYLLSTTLTHAWLASKRQVSTRYRVGWYSTTDRFGESILEDGYGHINRELAERIWEWEQDRRKRENLPKLDFSIRKGLRLVEKCVEKHVTPQHQVNDLVQEGLAALLDALSQYRHQEQDGSFEAFAARYIQRRLLASDSPRVPKAIQSIVKQAKRRLADRIHHQRDPSWAAVADDLNIPLERLLTYLRLLQQSGDTVSVESTVEILNPLLEDSLPAYRDQDEWELNTGLLLDDGKSVRKEEFIQGYLDETLENEGSDEAWVRQEQIAGPLSDIIPDEEENSTADDFILQELIKSDLNNFLSSSLDSTELKVVRAIFGLDTGVPLTAKQAAEAIGIKQGDVIDLLRRSILKLRHSYRARYLDDSDDDDVVDSV